jgi:hypothetical protein
MMSRVDWFRWRDDEARRTQLRAMSSQDRRGFLNELQRTDVGLAVAFVNMCKSERVTVAREVTNSRRRQRKTREKAAA